MIKEETPEFIALAKRAYENADELQIWETVPGFRAIFYDENDGRVIEENYPFYTSEDFEEFLREVSAPQCGRV